MTVGVLYLLPVVLTIYVYDHFLATKNINVLFLVIVIAVLLLSVDFILRFMMTYIFFHYLKPIEEFVYMKKIIDVFEASYISKRAKTPGEYIVSLFQVRKIFNFYKANSFLETLSFPYIFIYIIFIGHIHIILTIPPIAFALIFILYIYGQKNNISELIKKKEEHESEEFSFISDIFSGGNTLKALGAEYFIGNRYKQMKSEMCLVDYKIEKIEGKIKNYQRVLQQLVVVGIFYISARLSFVNTISLGELIACLFISTRLLSPIEKLFFLWKSSLMLTNKQPEHYIENNQSYCHLPQILESSFGNIQFNDVAYQCQAYNLVLSNISVNIAPGEKILLVHSSTHIKTLICKLAAGLLKPTLGKIYIGGNDSSELSPGTTENFLSYISGSQRMFPGTIMENLTSFESINLNHVEKILEETNFINEIKKLPDGINTIITGSRTDIISPRVKKGLILAREIAKVPKIMIIDNIEENLDEKDLNQFIKVLKDNMENSTLIISSQKKEFADLCTKKFEILADNIVTAKD